MKKNKNQVELDFYLLQYNQSKDLEWMQKIIEMYDSGKLTIKVLDGDPKFIAHSKYKGKCSSCNFYYQAGEGCFIAGLGKETLRYHTDCAPDEWKSGDLECANFYQGWKKQLIIGNK